MLTVITWWWPKEELEDPCPLHLSPEKARPDTYDWTSNSSLTWGLLGKGKHMRGNASSETQIFLDMSDFLKPIRHQVPKCWKVLSPDGHVQCHTWDCQLCMWVLCMTLHSCTVWCLCCYWNICIQFTTWFHSHNFKTRDRQNSLQRLQAGMGMHIIRLSF